MCTWHDAEQDFNDVFSKRLFFRLAVTSNYGFDHAWLFQNYLMHRILSVSEELDMTVQFHTGYLGGRDTYLPHSNPEGLIPLIFQYPDLRFDLLHMGYPYQGVLGAIAKNYPNAFINLCWAHIISPNVTVSALTEWLNLLPANKIIGFGSDVNAVDLVAGNLEMARENIAEVLALAVNRGILDEDGGQEIALKWLYQNPKNIYGLDD